MQEMMLINAADPYSYATWFDLNFTLYPVGTTTGYSDHGITFNRADKEK